jgi:hypothetical protein
MFETWYKMSSMLQSGLNMDPIITHHFDIDHGVRAVRQGHPALELIARDSFLYGNCPVAKKNTTSTVSSTTEIGIFLMKNMLQLLQVRHRPCRRPGGLGSFVA